MNLPGQEVIAQGLADLDANRLTIPALLVAIGAPRLRRLGHSLPSELPETPEHRLYDLLASRDPRSAHSDYQAWIRRLVSYERSAEALRGRELRSRRIAEGA